MIVPSPLRSPFSLQLGLRMLMTKCESPPPFPRTSHINPISRTPQDTTSHYGCSPLSVPLTHPYIPPSHSLCRRVVMTLSLFHSLTQVRLLIELCVRQKVAPNDTRSFNLVDVSLDHFFKSSRPSFFHLCTTFALTDSVLHELMTPRPEMTGVFHRY